MAQHTGDEAEATRKLRGAKIRELRLKAGLRKSELAARCGSSYSHIDNIENGRKRPSGQLAERLAEHLGVTSDEIALGDTLGDTTLRDSA
ncbi:helix-turn-helix domain-containing protein [Actinomadura madurae]|uniref:helix-turn-helix domain-containing protein n=1 Tax=Actinomadura madurae TaxID=1993 RepID=UPI0020D218F3|nr:helix-turn-helix transcriptional regulator [Actinomadura madurae]MCP9947174.1 helix-turn-helix domain-containing protein [Actinomadura madurae]MCP9963940.1 helix-turn-helix domain-containing protein [Actinomadura madurae]MCP9976415.1 helix-turn-helix domain-containing protein [Actinomadura madurae]MCQ0012093.1 helix-turn-helix domain-containing protein [Actinomadura madurae]MCQ0012607.1 helix-turn-helix domain-containing protein [Actinomadura madurae]